MNVTMTINLCMGYGNNCDLDHLQDVDIRKGVDRVVVMIMMVKVNKMVMVILI